MTAATLQALIGCGKPVDIPLDVEQGIDSKSEFDRFGNRQAGTKTG
ncbi:hypothetical protein [Rhizobium ruizarguesonis]|nr:hypothetical protein [Rhizobium ruizarguesonis]